MKGEARAQNAAATDRVAAREEGEGEAMAAAQEYDGQRQQQELGYPLISTDYKSQRNRIANQSHR